MHGGDIYRNEVEYDFSVNINALPAPPSVYGVIREEVENICHYPDIHQWDLRCAIAAKEGVSPEQIVCGNGASELIFALFAAWHPEKILLPVPCFSEYIRGAGAFGSETRYYQRKESLDFALDEEFLDEITPDTDMLILCEPNNPSGGLTKPELLERIAAKCQECGCLLVIDGCFLGFTGKEKEYKKLIKKWKMIRLNAFTKMYAMPGIRLGYCVLPEENMAQKLIRVLPAWNVSGMAMAAGIAALKEMEYVEQSRREMEKERAYLAGELEKFGFRVFSSQANFLLFSGQEGLYEKLLQRRTLIRDCSDYPGLSAGYYRVAVKSHEHNRHLVSELLDICTT